MDGENERDARLARLLRQFERELATGLAPDDGELAARFPELMPELAVELKKRRAVDRARRAARTPLADVRSTVEHDASTGRPAATADAGRVREAPEPDAGGARPNQVEATAAPSSRAGNGFDDYELLDVVGRGGMGVVYRAWQRSLQRVVAVKMLWLAEFAGDDERRRFQAEAEAAAALDHPGVVTVYETGVARAGTSDEAPFFSMAYVRGRSLHQLLRDSPPPARAVAKWLAEAAEAIDYAHSRGVLHRDLKPHNILVDEDDRARVTDFGLSKRVFGGGQLTISGQVLGTPGYMAPEQAEGNRNRIGPASDVYGLGGTLYACLTSRAPFVGESPAEILLQVLEQEPAPPRLLNPNAPRDLETICLKCLDKQPERRYSSAAALAADLKRFLNHEPIEARPAGRLERAWRWARRQPWRAVAAGLATVALALVVVLGIGGVLAARNQARLRRAAESSKVESDWNVVRAEDQQTRLRHKLAELHLAAGEHQAALEQIDRVPPSTVGWDTRRLRREAMAGPRLLRNMTAGFWGALDADLHRASGRLVAVDAAGSMRIWEVERGVVVREPTAARRIEQPGRPPRDAHHGEGREAGSSLADWGDLAAAVRWDSSGKSVVAASLNGRLLRYDVERGAAVELFKASEPLERLARDARQTRLLVGGGRGGLYLRRDDGGELATAPGESPVTALQALPDGAWAVGRADGTIEVRDERLTLTTSVRTAAPVWCLASDGGRRLAAGAGKPRPELYDWEAEARLLRLVEGPAEPPTGSRPEAAGVHALSFSADGERLLVGDELGRAGGWRVGTSGSEWRLQAARRSHPYREPLKARGRIAEPALRSSTFERRFAAIFEGREPGRVVTATDDAAVREWSVETPEETGVVRFVDRAASSPRLAFDPQAANLLWVLDGEGRLSVYDSRSGRRVARLAAHERGVDLAIGADGTAATAGDERRVRLWRYDVRRRTIVAARPGELAHERPLIGVAVAPDGRRIAAVDDRSTLVVWDAQTGAVQFSSPLSELRGRPATGRVAFNCDGSLLAACGAGQTAVVFQTAPFRRLAEQLAVAGQGGLALRWSAVDPSLLRATDDVPRAIQQRFGPVRSGRLELQPTDDLPASQGVAIDRTSDGRRWARLEQGGRIVFATHDFMIPVHEIRHPRGYDADLAFDVEGRRMAVAARDGSIEVWRTQDPPPAPDEHLDRSDAWSATRLATLGAETHFVRDGNFQFDSQGRLTGLLNRRTSESATEVWFLRQEDGRLRFERATVDDSPADRRITLTSTALAFHADGRPMIGLRRLTKTAGPYDGAVERWTLERAGGWRREVVEANGNAGHWLNFSTGETGGDELFHYDYGRECLLHSRRTDDGWKTRIAGDWGGGQLLSVRAGRDGVVHLIDRPARFPGDTSATRHLQWQDGRWSAEPIGGRPDVVAQSLAVLPDGRPLASRRDHGRVSELLVRNPTGWETWATAPGDGEKFERLSVGPDGAVHLLELLGDDRGWELRLLSRRDGRWLSQTVAKATGRGRPDFANLLFDAEGRPAVAAGRLQQPFGWLELFRPAEPAQRRN